MGALKAPLGLYNAKGEVKFFHTDETVQVGRREGFTHPKSPVFQEWPKDAYEKGTGRSRQVKDQAALDALGSNWGLTVVEAPAAPKPGALSEVPRVDNGKFVVLEGEMADMKKRINEKDATIDALSTVVTSLTDRLATLESLVMDVSPKVEADLKPKTAKAS